MKLLAAILSLLTLPAPAGERRWDVLEWLDDRGVSPVAIVLWEVELRSWPFGQWQAFATTYEPEARIDGLPEGEWAARVRAFGIDGTYSPFCRPVRFAVPMPALVHPATHARLTISRSIDGGATWTPIVEHDDKIGRSALYRMESSLVTLPK